MEAPTFQPASALSSLLARPLLSVPAVLLLAPGVWLLARDYWSTEQGAAGPIIFLTGLWLLWDKARGLTATPGKARLPIALVWITYGGCLAVAASITAKQWLQVIGIGTAAIAVLYYLYGLKQLRPLWMPLAYLVFMVPLPDFVTVPLTHHMKAFVADLSVYILQAMGYAATRAGSIFYIGPYELVVAAACSGLNSIFSLSAIGLFYVYMLHRGNWSHALLLVALLIPIAVLANVGRVVILALVTYHFGDAYGQGLLHETAGVIIFALTLAMLVLFDKLLQPLTSRRASRREAAHA